MRIFAPVVLAVALLAGCAPAAPSNDSDEIRVAAASDLQFALSEIIDDFERVNPAASVKVSYGSSGQFVQQIVSGAPFDVYLSADRAYVLDLVDSGHADAERAFDYAVGRLALFTGQRSGIDISAGLDVLTDDTIRSVSIANPSHAPYGRAAVAAMRSAGVYAAAEPKFVLGENISQAAEFVLSGNAQIGIVALALAVSPRMLDAGDYVEIPARLHPPLRQGGAVLKRAADSEVAAALVSYLTEEEGQSVLARYGFEPPMRGE